MPNSAVGHPGRLTKAICGLLALLPFCNLGLFLARVPVLDVDTSGAPTVFGNALRTPGDNTAVQFVVFFIALLTLAVVLFVGSAIATALRLRAAGREARIYALKFFVVTGFVLGAAGLVLFSHAFARSEIKWGLAVLVMNLALAPLLPLYLIMLLRSSEVIAGVLAR